MHMEIPSSDLQEFNPRWRGEPQYDLPDRERTVSGAIWSWCQDKRTKRSLLLTGASTE